MISLQITGLYASVLALLFIFMSALVIKLRLQHKVGIGDGGVSPLAKAIRVHGNFAEFVPFAIVLMAIYEINGGTDTALHVAGVILVISRISHLLGLLKTKGSSLPRVIGVLATYGIILTFAVKNIINFLA